MSPEDVTLEVFRLPDFTLVKSDSLTFCTPSPNYELDLGSYRVRGTALATGMVKEADVTVVAGVVTPVDLSFVPITHTLTVNSEPVLGIPFKINGVEKTTPYSGSLEEKTYTVTMPSSAFVEGKRYEFVQWEDGSTNPTRTLNLVGDITITATYKLAPISPISKILSIAIPMGILYYFVRRG